jgi:hypothetical protein
MDTVVALHLLQILSALRVLWNWHRKVFAIAQRRHVQRAMGLRLRIVDEHVL